MVKGWADIPESYVTQVPVLTLDRLLGTTLQGRKALILVDVEGAEFMMLQGATIILQNDPMPIWMVEISSTEHQPVGIAVNPYFEKTFECFFAAGYRAFTADMEDSEIKAEQLQKFLKSKQGTKTHNFIFRD